ncbi:MAG: transposase [Myxococcales bacterium]|nr:MAG: transposase [Myxococcales bacterium]
MVFEPLDLTTSLCALVPPPRSHLLRYHGVLAAHAKEHGQVVPGLLDEEPGAQLHLWGDDPAETPGPNSWQLCSR